MILAMAKRYVPTRYKHTHTMCQHNALGITIGEYYIFHRVGTVHRGILLGNVRGMHDIHRGLLRTYGSQQPPLALLCTQHSHVDSINTLSHHSYSIRHNHRPHIVYNNKWHSHATRCDGSIYHSAMAYCTSYHTPTLGIYSNRCSMHILRGTILL